MMTGNEKTALRPMALYTAVYLLWFRLVEALPRSSYQVIELALDRKIPFVEEFVLPYVSWFAFVPLGVLLLLKYDREMYDRAVTFLMTGMTVFLLVSTLFPNMQFLRPFILPRENVFTKLIGLLWMVDTPTNVSPSIHVFNTLAILVMIWKSRAKELKGLRLRLMWTVWGALIIPCSMCSQRFSWPGSCMSLCSVTEWSSALTAGTRRSSGERRPAGGEGGGRIIFNKKKDGNRSRRLPSLFYLGA